MSDKTGTRKTSGGIRAGRGRAGTIGGAAKPAGPQGKSRSGLAERKSAPLQGASEDGVAATDMSGPLAEATPFAASDAPEAGPDEADGAPGSDREARAPDASASDTDTPGTPSGRSPHSGAPGQPPAEEPGEAAAISGEATEGATEGSRNAVSEQAPPSASADTEARSGPALAEEAAAPLLPADAEAASGPVGGQAPGRGTRAKKPAATRDTAPPPAKTRRRTRADAASPQAAGAAAQDSATGAGAKPARRRRKTDSQTASESPSTSAPRKSPDRKAPGRRAEATAEAASGGARAAEAPSAPRRGRKAAAGPAAGRKAPGRDEAATPAATPQAAPMPAAAGIAGAGSVTDFFPAPGTGAGVVPGLGLLSSLSGAPPVASLAEAHGVLEEAAEISRIGMDANMRAAQSLAGARSPAELLARQADSMRILADAWMRQGARISELWLRMMRASS